ncbi:MAG: ATPase AAA core protein [Dehalococcoidia bacterium]|nr:ATPase AAA core protein [Dehalococcoidia bacterium]
MIKTLEIKNFKSIKHLKLDCKRVNVFIGEPNTGKSNLLEALSLFSFAYYCRYGYKLKDFVRIESVSNLFYDESLDETVQIVADDKSIEIGFKDNHFQGQVGEGGTGGKAHFSKLSGDYTSISVDMLRQEASSAFKLYKFVVREAFQQNESGFLLPPFGDNLFSLLMTHRELRSLVTKFLSGSGLRLGFRKQERKLELIKHADDVFISYPYSLASDTLQRIIFHLAAVISNKDSVLILEEPEAHAFPYYTKYLAEVIALDENKNQYFISTHNPYFLEPILEKTPKDEIGIFITYFKDYETKVKQLSQRELEKIMEIDVFLNLDRFVKA